MQNIILKAQGPGPSYAEIRRVDNTMNNPLDQRNRMMLSTVQESAYSKALAAVKAGEDDEARAHLKHAFDTVIVEHP